MTRSPLIQLAVGALICATGLVGCSASSTSSAPAAKSAAATGSATASAAATASGAVASGVPAGSIEIIYEENAQAELILPTGQRILIDVWNPDALSAPPIASDILLTTHSHDDHYRADFVDSFPGKKLTWETGPLKVDDVTVTGISALHDEGLAEGSDFIYVIDAGGFRIAHFGDLGQDKLTNEQLATIGKVDIAFSQLSNSYSSMDENNKKGLNLMNQVKPRLVIPTHLSQPTAELAVAGWKGTFATGPITIRPDQLPAQTTICFMGAQAANYGQILNLTPSAW